MIQAMKMKGGPWSLFWMALLLVAMSNSALAQMTASITGRVEDSSGAGIPEAMVTATSLETGAARTITADDSGSYRVVSLTVGRYEVKAEQAGFKSAVQTGITLVVGQQAVVNLTLQVGQVQQQVTVTGEAPLVNTTTASISGLIEEREVKELPLNGRSFDSLISLNSGRSVISRPGAFPCWGVAKLFSDSHPDPHVLETARRRMVCSGQHPVAVEPDRPNWPPA